MLLQFKKIIEGTLCPSSLSPYYQKVKCSILFRCVCVCVRERERERETGTEREFVLFLLNQNSTECVFPKAQIWIINDILEWVPRDYKNSISMLTKKWNLS